MVWYGFTTFNGKQQITANKNGAYGVLIAMYTRGAKYVLAYLVALSDPSFSTNHYSLNHYSPSTIVWRLSRDRRGQYIMHPFGPRETTCTSTEYKRRLHDGQPHEVKQRELLPYDAQGSTSLPAPTSDFRRRVSPRQGGHTHNAKKVWRGRKISSKYAYRLVSRCLLYTSPSPRD